MVGCGLPNWIDLLQAKLRRFVRWATNGNVSDVWKKK